MSVADFKAIRRYIWKCNKKINLVVNSLRMVFKKIRRLLGGRIKAVISGGATLNAETHRFLNICICPTVLQGYGLTEICAAGAISDSKSRLCCFGKAIV